MQQVFDTLKAILTRHAEPLVVVHDRADSYYLDTKYIMKNGQPLYFGSVAIKARYVSYHLMPVYVYPALLAPVSDGLRKRMQGKSCFNFRKPDDRLFAELAELTARGFDAYRDNGQI